MPSTTRGMFVQSMKQFIILKFFIIVPFFKKNTSKIKKVKAELPDLYLNQLLTEVNQKLLNLVFHLKNAINFRFLDFDHFYKVGDSNYFCVTKMRISHIIYYCLSL